MNVSPPPEVCAAMLAVTPGLGAKALAEALRAAGPAAAWARARKRGAALPQDVQVAAALRAAHVEVTWIGHGAYPASLADDPEPPPILFHRGSLTALTGPRVAIVGARDCTRYGREVAHELGRDLSLRGVRIVSGLALGIDGAAHSGALAAAGAGSGGGRQAGAGAVCAVGPPVAVVGSGLDVVYPRRHARLWQQVADAGVVLSEAPMGARPEPWRFPARNRIIAALADVVVVVESRHRGGSRHTVDAAAARDRTVMAVPGPVRSPQSELPNALLAEGCAPARDALDVLVALGLASSHDTGTGRDRSSPPDPRPAPEGCAAAVLDGLGWQRRSFEQIVVAAARSPGEVGVALAHLERDGWVAGSGGWWERVTDVGNR